jgi:hypothetical protein
MESGASSLKKNRGLTVAVLKRDLIQSPTHLQFLINIVATKYS